MSAPQGTDRSFHIRAGETRVLTLEDFGLAGPDAAQVHTVILFPYGSGRVDLNGQPVSGDRMIGREAIESGLLRYTAPELTSVDALAFSLMSSEGVDPTAANLVFEVSSTFDTLPLLSAGEGVLGVHLPGSADTVRRLVIDDEGRVTSLHAGVVGADWVLVRMLATGAPDPSFGSGTGRVTSPVSSAGNVARDLVRLQDGGYLIIEAGGPDGIEVTRLTATGALDTGFAGDGQAEVDLPGVAERGRALLAQDDGRVLVAYSDGGRASVLRLAEDGTRDLTFGDAGRAVGPPGTPTELLQQPDGKIVVVGTGSLSASGGPSNFIARFNADGTPDTAFGTNGAAEVPGTPLTVWDAVVQADGRIVVVTSLVDLPAQPATTALYRYNPDGSRDLSFGAGGRVLFGDGGNSGAALVQQPDGKLLASTVAADDFIVVRLDSAGHPDTSFGSGGMATVQMVGTQRAPAALALAPDGGIVLGGQSLAPGEGSVIARLTADGRLDVDFAAQAFIRGGPAVAIDPDLGMHDAESAAGGPRSETAVLTTLVWGGAPVEIRQVSAQGNHDGLTVTVRREGGADASDVFSASGPLVLAAGVATLDGVTIGTVIQTAGMLSLVFNGTATTARVHETLRSIAYANTADMPPTDVRLLWTVSDGAGSASAASTLHILAAGATLGNDRLTGTPGADRIDALEGNDRIEGRGGSDIIEGGPGIDTFVLDVSTDNVLSHPVAVDFSAGRLGGFGSSLGVVDLSGIERVRLADALYAFDTAAPHDGGPGGHVWQAAALLRAGFGTMPDRALLSRWTAEADRLPDMDALAQALLDAYAPGVSPEALVAHLSMTVLGVEASPDTVQAYAALVGPGKPFHTVAELFSAAATLPENLAQMTQLTGSIQVLDPSWFEAP